jgi:Flp pilus assembly protein TadD
VRLAAALLAAGALGLAPGAFADGTETEPDLAKRDADYAAARNAIQAKNWNEAIARLKLAEKRNPEHADLQNYLGYSYRNLKQFDLAFSHYKRALELDPRHRGAHEYIGEAYLMTGDLKSAEKHLALLKGICLLGCEELADLDKAVAEYRKKN